MGIKMNNTTREEVILRVKEIETRSKLPAFEKNYTEKDYAIRELEKLVFKLLEIIEKQETMINNKLYNKYITEYQYKIALNKIKTMFKEEMHEDGCEFCDKLEKLLEEIE